MQNASSGQLSLAPFKNEPLFAGPNDPIAKEAFPKAIAAVRSQLTKPCPLSFGGQEVTTEAQVDSLNPNNPDEIVGRVSQASKAQVDQAIEAADQAFQSWKYTSPQERAAILVKAAKILRDDIYTYSAWQVLEEGKQWAQAYNDVTEGIDFLEYYAREIIRLGGFQDTGSYAGESNHYYYQPKGLTAVIAPWNFPLAISIGMAGAAIAAGSCVVYKPSNVSPVVGYHLVEVFKAAGLPDGVFNYIPGRGSEIGDYIVEHPKIAVIAFTGSMEVGLRIINKAGNTGADQLAVKKIISEMGGKNAIIVDDDTDVATAVPQILYSAFGFQGQKCSACSRLIVHDKVYDELVPALIAEAKKLKVGPSEDPQYYMGAVIDSAAHKTIKGYVALAESEGKLLYKSEVPDKGYYIPMTITEGITPKDRLAQEEVFGPVLAIMRAKDFDQALEWANSTRFALTGACFSKKRANLDRVTREYQCGNLYLNRGCVGALVGVQPFGGFRMSGVGTKAGGQDYLLHFMDPRCVTEQPMDDVK